MVIKFTSLEGHFRYKSQPHLRMVKEREYEGKGHKGKEKERMTPGGRSGGGGKKKGGRDNLSILSLNWLKCSENKRQTQPTMTCRITLLSCKHSLAAHVHKHTHTQGDVWPFLHSFQRNVTLRFF